MSGEPGTSEPPHLFYTRVTADEFVKNLCNALEGNSNDTRDDIKNGISKSTQAITESNGALAAAILGRERSATPPAVPRISVSPSVFSVMACRLQKKRSLLNNLF